MEGTANILREADPLHEAARFVCEALDFAPNGFAIVRLDGTCVTVNRTLAAWIRPALTVEELGGVSLLAGDDGKLAAALRRAALGESVVVETSRVQFVTAREGPFRLHVMPFRLGGSVQAASVVFEDRREQALTVEAFEASERRFRLMVDSASDGIAVHRRGILLYVNPAAVRLLGCDSADEIVGRSLLDFVHSDSDERARSNLRELIASGQVATTEQLFARRDGTSVLVEVSGSRAPLGQNLSSLALLRRVADQKQAKSERDRGGSGAVPHAAVNARVLICDDEQRLASLTADLLGQYGYRTRTVASVEETIDALEQCGSDFDALLLDVNLPYGSAGRVLDRMRQIGCAAPVILTSGYSVEDIASELLGDPHVVHYLAKPYPVEELVEVLSRVGSA